jgi:hypothetical protein
MTTNGKLQVRVVDIELPNLAYNFGEYAYKVWYIKDVGGADTLTSISLPITENIADGTALVAKLNALFTANGDSITASINANSYKLTFTNDDALLTYRFVSSYRYNDLLSTTYDDCMDRLGFTQDLRTTTIAPAGTLTGASCIKMLRTNCYYLTCDVLGAEKKQNNVPTPYKQPNILGKIIAYNFGLVSQLQYSSDIYYSVSEKQIDRLAFTLLDDQLNPISINEGGITITLEIVMV